MAARNMYRIEINTHKKLCVKLVIYEYIIYQSNTTKFFFMFFFTI